MSYLKTVQQVLERDNYTCQTCFKQFDKSNPKGLDVHHLISRRKQGLDSINNLTSVCRTCHGLIETKPKKYNFQRKYTTIRVSVDLIGLLSSLGVKGESYEDVILRLIAESKKKWNVNIVTINGLNLILYSILMIMYFLNSDSVRNVLGFSNYTYIIWMLDFGRIGKRNSRMETERGE